MAEKQSMYSYNVTGHGLFPFDMLRHDSAWPASENNSALIEQTTKPRHRTKLTVKVHGLSYPTVPRWASFGWEVTQVETLRTWWSM